MWNDEEEPEVILRELFVKVLQEQSPELGNEFDRYISEPLETQSKPPSHSLELNLILVFIYMASRTYGILEKDVLVAA